MLLVTAYYGPFDLLPVFLGFSGIRASVAYRPHADVSFDVFRRTIRRLGGCQLIPVDETPWRISDELAAGRTVAVLSDHHASDRGVPATFLGLETRVPRSIGLLAKRYDAAVAVAGIRRIGCGFRFEIVVTDVIEPSDWRCRPDEVEYITNRYLRGLERLIMGDPTQYLWARARWGEETAVRLVEEDLRSRAIADMKSSTR
jgi:lauroyl/myristoyl acyltransferase